MYLIRRDFPLDFDPQITLKHEIKHHKSANDFPQHIKAHLKEETQFQEVLGTFAQPHILNLHVSPSMTREKPGAAHCRVIVDLSFPENHSVNTDFCIDMYID